MPNVDGGLLIKDLTLGQLRQLVAWGCKLKPEEISDDMLRDWQERLGELTWMNANQVIIGEIKPRKKMIDGEENITALHIATTDGYKDNTIDHYVITNDDKVINIRNQGQSDLEFGDLCSFNCTTRMEDKDDAIEAEPITYYNVKNDTSPQVEKTFPPDQVFERMREVKKNAWDVKEKETAILEINLTHKVSPWKKEGDKQPVWTKDTTECGFRMTVKGLQRKPTEEEDPTYVSLLFRPQKYGRQEFYGLLPEKYNDKLSYVGSDDLLEEVIRMIVPQPPELTVFVIGRIKHDTYRERINVSLSPCAGAMLDEKSQMPDFLKEFEQALESGEVQQNDPEPEEEAEDMGDLKEASLKMVKSRLKFGKNLSLDGINAILKEKGYYATEATFKKAQKELGR